jgi:hypothetical protein
MPFPWRRRACATSFVAVLNSPAWPRFRLFGITRSRGHRAIAGHGRQVVDGWSSRCKENGLRSLSVRSEIRVRVACLKKGAPRKPCTLTKSSQSFRTKRFNLISYINQQLEQVRGEQMVSISDAIH